MNIEEAKNLKRQMQDNICAEIEAFTRQTGLVIANMSLRRYDCLDASGNIDTSTAAYGVDISVEV